MKRHLLTLLFVWAAATSVLAENIPQNRIITLGINAYQQRSHAANVSVKNTDFITADNDTLLAVLHFEDGGFIIMSADDAVLPVLAYSTENDFPLENMAPAARYWLGGYKEMIIQARKQGAAASPEVSAQWQQLAENIRTSRSVVVPPLISATWNQSEYYNDLCPADEDSPAGYGGHVPNGCVALAMAMVIHYYRYPETGQGSHSYTSSYGYHSVDYSQQTYNYNAMPYVVNKPNHEVAKLIYHCGIAVNMGYSPEGSGSQTEYTRSGLIDYYKYSSDAAYVNRGNGGWGGFGGYSETQWRNLLKTDLDNGYPIIYSGYNDEGGHAFLCDGYDSDNYFHFNLGWGGSNNGFYSISSDDDNAVATFNQGQAMVHNIHPPLANYPPYCSQTHIVNASAGSLEDGSGHLNYQNNTNCTYIILPENGKNFFITLVDLDLEENHDFLKIWNGDPENGGTLVATYTGNTFNPNHLDYITGGAAYITFTSDGAGTGRGWKLRFTSKRHVSCQSSKTFTAKNGTFDDGSGDEVYAADASCYWTIKPNNASYVLLSFNNFDLSPEDKVVIYDGTDISTANILATCNTNPGNIASHTGVMKVAFSSDNYLERAGFTATWSSDGDESTPEGVSAYDDELPFDIFPNPAHSQLFLQIPSRLNDAQLRITDINGRIIRTCRIAELPATPTLDLSNIANGIYMVTLFNHQEICTKKLIINK